MYHIKSQSREHSRHGVAESAVSTRELVSERFEFAREAIAKLQAPASEPDDSFDPDDSRGR
jgi:hypothetical protein